ncbi:hypothetical protein Q1W71_02940 [Flavobacterium pectinovorum]|uniref:hypothetical protein n=1 Tax=Flavobacterium pectinovorum TaxID=29533 RepID=UPI00266027E6|nr:hypothetical protein [Flavobacterium pectinovorum]WKL48744.1 hypothetical protein Q1W71_02940 [Flavobacterium pectinovorum]
MKKLLLYILTSLIIIIIFRFLIIKIIFFLNTNRCSSSEYVADGDRIWIKLDSYFINVNEKDIIVKISNNNVPIYQTDSINKLNLYIDSKILVKDTLTISIKNTVYKIYNFENGGQMSKAGQDRGNFHCGILKAKINGKNYNFYGYNEIFLDKQ